MDNFIIEDDEGVKTTIASTSKIEAVKVLYGFEFVKFAGYHDDNLSSYYKAGGRWFLVTRETQNKKGAL